jgi:hypothetical protein
VQPGRLLHHLGVSAAAGTASSTVCVMAPLLVLAQGWRHDRPLSPPSAAISAGGWLEPRRAGYRSSPATRLMVVARMTAPSRYESSAWRSTVARRAAVCSSVSETWKVIPTVKAR